ncbi:MAG: hypothetical protein RL518_706 [Pseudomonadota bacterium]|jgi:hypothetical protein
MDRSSTLLTFLTITLMGIALPSTSSWALSSCEIERPSQVIHVQRGSSSTGTPLSTETSDPTILLRSTTDNESFQLGIGGSITLQFKVPVANYPSAGLLAVERPQGALPCSSYPVRAEISGSIDGENFVPLGTTCESAALQLGAFPWISYLRIRDITDPSDPAFGSNPIEGFDLRSISGPECLKFAHCAVPAVSDSSVTDGQGTSAVSLSELGDDFVFEHQAVFEEYGNGSARLSGTIYRLSDPSKAYEMIVSLTGRVQSPPPQSPVLNLKSSAYTSAGGSIDPSSWYYYKKIEGVLLGKRDLSGDKVSVATTLQAFQIGDGAQGRNTSLGASGSFAYASASSLHPAEITINLTSCTSPATPTPPPATPTQTPTRVDAPPTCETSDISDKLATLDHSLARRFSTISRATRLLVDEKPTRQNLRFRTSIRAKVHNLYVRAWGDVWRHARVVQSCSPSTLCSDIHLAPLQASLATSADLLDSTIERAIARIQQELSTRKARSALKLLIQQHTSQRRIFVDTLSVLPRHSTVCR